MNLDSDAPLVRRALVSLLVRAFSPNELDRLLALELPAHFDVRTELPGADMPPTGRVLHLVEAWERRLLVDQELLDALRRLRPRWSAELDEIGRHLRLDASGPDELWIIWLENTSLDLVEPVPVRPSDRVTQVLQRFRERYALPPSIRRDALAIRFDYQLLAEGSPLPGRGRLAASGVLDGSVLELWIELDAFGPNGPLSLGDLGTLRSREAVQCELEQAASDLLRSLLRKESP